MRLTYRIFFCLLFSIFCFPVFSSEEPIENQLQKHIKFSLTESNKIGLISVDDRSSTISEATWLYVKQALEYYKKEKPIFIILKLNTPGGEVFAAQKISDALKDFDIQNEVPVVAYIDNWAISAGAMLAYSSRFIAISKDASMGAAEPVQATETGELKAASEKVNSAIRADFANRAKFFGRNPYIAEGMVDKELILISRNGSIIKVDSESQMRTTGENPDILIKPKGKLLTLNAEQLMEYNVANIQLPIAKMNPITDEEKVKGKWPANKMLLFQAPFFSKIPNATIDAYQMDWKTQFFVFLANPVVSSLLIMGLMAGFYLEMSSPGFGLPGMIALICLFLIVLSNLSLQIANWLEIIIMVTGLLIVLVDIFLVPTFGLLGIIGGFLFFVGLFAMMLPALDKVSFDFDTQTLNAAGIAFLERLAWLSGTIILGTLLILFLARFVTPKIASWSRLVLAGNEQDASRGYIAGDRIDELPKKGSKGTVLATLRPAGKIIIEKTVYDALAEGNYIEKGTPIFVTRLDGSVIVVDIDIGMKL